MERTALVVIPAGGPRAQLERARPRRRRPNEACGLVAPARRRSPSATCRGRNAAARPYRFELDVDPEVWFLEDEGYELAVFHSHPRPRRAPRGRTSRHRPLGGRPYLIYGSAGELPAWRITPDEVKYAGSLRFTKVRAVAQFVEAMNAQVGREFAASQQYIAIAVYYDAETLPRSRRTSTGRRSRSETTR